MNAISGFADGHACGCVGPKKGQPLCPCRMRNVRNVNGRWVETIDHGPVSAEWDAERDRLLGTIVWDKSPGGVTFLTKEQQKALFG